MEINVDDYEKLGAFYLGREYDLGRKELEDSLLMYDSKDLVTHGVVLGMTGSGKTGLCLALLEEAAIDGVPAIVIDPKGDIANLLLNFPGLKGKDFLPWINEEDARRKEMTPEAFAQGQADLWKKGLGQWGQGQERMQKLKDCVDVTVYTPGSNAGIPVSILSSLEAPSFEIIDDSELFGDRVESTVSSLLSLLGLDADPIQSRDHILLSNIFSHCWRKGENVSLAALIQYIQTPPFDQVGVLDLESFYPEKKRFELAMRINNLLAAPGFGTWLTGESLDIQRMYFTPEGKPRISIFSIAHLSDSERMFFVSMLFNQVLSWMRAQSGTSSLRALLYMDEIYGYLPPTANPPSKKPIMTMLKQARAFGLGILLATQNPVDLDYKALSNIGSWFLGRLQTERDKMRVLDGLEGAAATQGSTFDRGDMEEHLAGLGSRVFLLNNVHEDAPVTFHVRWVMSYLRGPLTRGQIRKLMDAKRADANLIEVAKPVAARTTIESGRSGGGKSGGGNAAAAEPSGPPKLSSRISQHYLPTVGVAPGERITYLPALLRVAEVTFADAKHDVFCKKVTAIINRLDGGRESVDWSNEEALPVPFGQVLEQGHDPGDYEALPTSATRSTTFTAYKSRLIDELYEQGGFDLFRSPSTGLVSKPGEIEADFRVRLKFRMREERDMKIEKLRLQYSKKIASLEEKYERALAAVERERAQSSGAKMDTAISIGSTILGAIFGRKSRSRAVTGGTRAARGASRAWKQGRDVAMAEKKASEIRADLEEIEIELQGQIMEIKDQMDSSTEEFESFHLPPKKKDIDVLACGILWLPHYRLEGGQLQAAW